MVSNGNKLLISSSLIILQLVTSVLLATDDHITAFNYNCHINSLVDERPRLGISVHDEIKILVSNRVTHQLVSRIFAIQLREYFGFKKVTLKLLDHIVEIDTSNTTNKEHRKLFLEQDELLPLKSEQIINLEVWMLPDYNELRQDVSILGPIFAPGRFGFFIPRVLLQNNTTHYYSYKMFAQHGGSSSINEYVIDDHVLKRLDSSIQTKEYIPKHCNNKTCAHLLAPVDCQFIIKHINHLKLYIRVIFIETNFNSIVDRLIKLYIQNPAMMLAQRKFIILHWYPSDITMGPHDMIKFEMPQCEDLNEECKYDLTPVLKMCSKAFLKNHLPLFSLSEHFHFESNQLHNLLKLYETKLLSGNLSYQTGIDQIYNDVSCEYVKGTYNYIELKNLYSSFVKDNIVIVAWYLSNGIDRQILNTVAEMAEKSVNNYLTNLNGFPNDTQFFEVKRVAINCTSDEAMNKFVGTYYSDPQLVGFTGPICEELIESIAGPSKHFKLPFISYAGEGSFLSDRSKYPYIYRTIGETREIEKIYLHIFNQFLWTRVATLSEEGLKTASYLIHLDELLKHSNKEMVANKKFDCNRRNSLLEQQLKYLKSINAYIIIADVSDTCLYSFACELYKTKMTSQYGYVWFLPDWSLRHINKLNNGYDSCSFEELHEAINGHFSLKHISYMDDNVTTVEHKTVKQWRNQYYDMVGDDKYISNYAVFLYDSIWAYGIALNNLFKTRKNYKQSDLVKDLAKEISHVNFTGISGNVYFNEEGSRLIDIHLMQSQNRKLNVIGMYGPEFVQLGNKSTVNWKGHLNESGIVWFTKMGQIPTDGRKICAFKMLANLLNTSCEVTTAVMVCLGCLLFVVLISIGSFIFWKWKYDKKIEFMKKNGIDLLSELSENTLDKWEIPKERIVINRKLGEGAFGTVYGGEAQLMEDGAWTAVAVKTLKMGSNREDRLNFLAEAETMKRFDHKNIIKLLGVCLSSEPIYTVMEYMLYGDLKTFLLARRHLVNEKNPDDSDLSPKRLTQMALDIAKALSYLSNEKFVHRDIACRNCLVNANKLIKLGDFGMARSMFENDYYKFNRKGMLPVRWMAPESLVLGIFTPASDIWSFGVLIYEFITFGAFPFQGMTNNEVLEYIKQGNTLTIPNGVKPQLEYLMRSCWKREYRDRLKASEICDYLTTNPRIITACIDDPLSSVQINDSETDQIELLKRLNIRPIGGDTTKSPNNNLTTGSLKRESNGHDVPATQARNLSYIEMNTLNLLPKQQNSSSLSPHYNPIEPLLVRSDSDISKSNTSLRRYVPMCGFNKNKSVPLNGDYESDFN